MTHDLFTEMLSQLEARVIRIAVTELRENTFYAMITVSVDGSEIEIDSRPSDAIALAVRAEAPIYAADSVIEESAIEFEHEDVNEEEVVEEFEVPRRGETGRLLDGELAAVAGRGMPRPYILETFRHLALGEVEQLAVDLAQALAGERA